METIPAALRDLIDDLSRLPGIGPKSATRLALHIMRRPQAEARQLAHSLSSLHESIRLCGTCLAFSEQDPCRICADPGRDHGLICVVEQPGDLMAIEKTGTYKGVYHLLHGALSPMDGIGPREIKIDALLARVRGGGAREVLIATSSTVPGEATAAYLAKELGTTVKVTRLACGIPMGMDIKYADADTLARAIEGRRRP